MLSGNPEGLKPLTGCPIKAFGHDGQEEINVQSIYETVSNYATGDRQNKEKSHEYSLTAASRSKTNCLTCRLKKDLTFAQLTLLPFRYSGSGLDSASEK